VIAVAGGPEDGTLTVNKILKHFLPTSKPPRQMISLVKFTLKIAY
jgi:hypothetical protein